MSDGMRTLVGRLKELRDERPSALLRRLVSTVRFAIARDAHGEQAARRALDRNFDAQFAIDTGVAHISTLRIDSSNRKHGVDHIASDPSELSTALDQIPEPLDAFTFVDLGSGKGRAVLLASNRPFRRIIGVEFAVSLHRTALENLARYPKAAQRCRDIELVCGDAAAYVLPDVPLVIFMYNPFGAEVMQAVAQRTAESLRRCARKVYVLYVNPFHANVWLEAGFEERSRRGNSVMLVLPQ